MSRKINVGMLKEMIKDADPKAKITVGSSYNLENSKLVNIGYDEKDKELYIIYDEPWH